MHVERHCTAIISALGGVNHDNSIGRCSRWSHVLDEQGERAVTADYMIWWVASLVVGVGAIPAGYMLVSFLERIEKRRRPANGPVPLSIERVFVASDLMPLIGGLVKAGIPLKGSELRVFGSDGRYVVNSKSKGWWRKRRKNKSKWRSEMCGWAATGLKIRYILLQADEEVKGVLLELKQEMGEQFEAVALNEGAIPDVALELETCHPTIFIGKNGQNAAWIEGFHPRDSVHAYDVEYISPCAMKRSRSAKSTFDYYAEKLDAVLENSHPLVNPIPART